MLPPAPAIRMSRSFRRNLDGNFAHRPHIRYPGVSPGKPTLQKIRLLGNFLIEWFRKRPIPQQIARESEH
jgi:hypothetical protein